MSSFVNKTSLTSGTFTRIEANMETKIARLRTEILYVGDLAYRLVAKAKQNEKFMQKAIEELTLTYHTQYV